MELGAPELLIILVIVILLFGVGRIAKTAGELGSGVRAFKKGLAGDDEEDEKVAANKATATKPVEKTIDTPVVMEADVLPEAEETSEMVEQEKQS